MNTLEPHRNIPHIRTYPPTVRRSTYIFSVSLAIIVSFVLGTRYETISQTLFGVSSQTGRLDLSSVQRTYDVLKREYDGELDGQKLIDGASRGLVAAMGDAYTVYMDKQEAVEFQNELSGGIGGGIGAEIGIRGGEPTIVMALSSQPAEKAGIKKGDVITGINNLSTKDWSLDKTIQQIRGEAGTSVKITIRRGGEYSDISITRAIVNNPSAHVSIKDEVGIIRLSRFDNTSGKLVRDAAKSLIGKRVKGIVLDLRDNGGGYVDAAQDVAGVWLKDEVILTERRGEQTISTEKSTGEQVLSNVPTVVLVNKGSASASEILAGAFRDHAIATILGERSFGKGTVQKIVELPGGRLLKVTVAHWYTPSGKSINNEGIIPNKIVEMTAKQIDADQDPQMEAALDTLLGR